MTLLELFAIYTLRIMPDNDKKKITPATSNLYVILLTYTLGMSLLYNFLKFRLGFLCFLKKRSRKFRKLNL